MIASRTVRQLQLALVLGVAAAFALAYLLSAEFRSEVGQAASVLSRGDVGVLRDYLLSFGALAPLASIAAMVLQALAAPVPVFLVVLANGLAFGVLWGWLLSLAGLTLAAAVCFGIARALGRDPVEALAGKAGLRSADRWFARWGVWAVLLTRLVPGMAFDAVSFAAGLTRMGFGRFIAATAVGSAPSTFIYAYLGREAPQYFWALLALSVVVIGGVLAAAFLGKRRARAGALTTRPEGGDARDGAGTRSTFLSSIGRGGAAANSPGRARESTQADGKKTNGKNGYDALEHSSRVSVPRRSIVLLYHGSLCQSKSSPPLWLYLEDYGMGGDVVVVAVPLEAHLQGLRGIDLTKGDHAVRAHPRAQFGQN